MQATCRDRLPAFALQQQGTEYNAHMMLDTGEKGVWAMSERFGFDAGGGIPIEEALFRALKEMGYAGWFSLGFGDLQDKVRVKDWFESLL